METGEISKKLKRGRHTTRHSQVIPVGEDTFLMDTPGFSSLYITGMEEHELKDYFDRKIGVDVYTLFDRVAAKDIFIAVPAGGGVFSSAG